MVPLGLLNGMKHSVSREDLFNSLSSPAAASCPPHSSEHGGMDSQKRTALHELQPKAVAKDDKFGGPNFKSSDVFNDRESGRQTSERGSKLSLASSLATGSSGLVQVHNITGIFHTTRCIYTYVISLIFLRGGRFVRCT